MTKKSFIRKYGAADEIDTADGFVDIWDGATDTILGFTKTPHYTYSTVADIDSVVSSSALDTTSVKIQGLDVNWDPVIQIIPLKGQLRQPLSTNLIRVFRKENEGATPFVGNIFCYVDGTLTAGVPDTEADVRSIIQIGNEKTLMAIFPIPNGSIGLVTSWYASTSKKEAPSEAHKKRVQINVIELRDRPEGGVFKLKHKAAIESTGTSYKQHKFDNIPEDIRDSDSWLDAKTDVVLRADTSKDQSAVSGGFELKLEQNS